MVDFKKLREDERPLEERVADIERRRNAVFENLRTKVDEIELAAVPNNWERDFLESAKERITLKLNFTEGQLSKLNELHEKYCAEPQEEEDTAMRFERFNRFSRR